MIRNERGLTLVELLATLTIIAFIGIIIWNVFLQGSKYAQNAGSKNSMIQEANFVIANLLKIHQTSDSYTINQNSSCSVTVTYTKGSVQQTQVFDDQKLCISISLNNLPGTINPNLIDVPLTLTVSDKQNSNNTISVNSTLYRVKGEQ